MLDLTTVCNVFKLFIFTVFRLSYWRRVRLNHVRWIYVRVITHRLIIWIVKVPASIRKIIMAKGLRLQLTANAVVSLSMPKGTLATLILQPNSMQIKVKKIKKYFQGFHFKIFYSYHNFITFPRNSMRLLITCQRNGLSFPPLMKRTRTHLSVSWNFCAMFTLKFTTCFSLKGHIMMKPARSQPLENV